MATWSAFLFILSTVGISSALFKGSFIQRGPSTAHLVSPYGCVLPCELCLLVSPSGQLTVFLYIAKKNETCVDLQWMVVLIWFACSCIINCIRSWRKLFCRSPIQYVVVLVISIPQKNQDITGQDMNSLSDLPSINYGDFRWSLLFLRNYPGIRGNFSFHYSASAIFQPLVLLRAIIRPALLSVWSWCEQLSCKIKTF